jgi:cobalt/nickel transport system permease protein
MISAYFFGSAINRIKAELASSRHIPYLAMAAAFAFLIQMFNIPIPGGTTGHAVGAGLIAIILGPWTATVAISVVIVVQALIFGDGGLTAVGANCLAMAVVMPFTTYAVFELIRRGTTTERRIFIASFVAGYAGLTAAAICTATLLGIQPMIAVGSDGRPLYAPYPLSVALPVMAAEHLLTAFIIKYIFKNDPGIIYAIKET